MKKFFSCLLLISLLFTFSCSGGGSSTSGGGSSGSDYGYLYQHNAGANNGIIIRWQTPIQVNTNGVAGAEEAFRTWGIPVTYVSSNPAEGITLSIGEPGAGVCGVTYSQWYRSNGRMATAQIVIASNLNRCVNTVTHEVCHALGYRGHSSDGGLMDPAGGNGQITAEVRNMINLLYSLPIGTTISPSQSLKSRALLKQSNRILIPDGGGMVTWVDR
jgi:hypothetical protein